MLYVYPKCANTFRKWCLINSKYENVYYKIGMPDPFDVTFRRQSITDDVSTNDKLKMYYNIIAKQNPSNIEVGNVDHLEIFNTIHSYQSLNTQNIRNNKKTHLEEIQNKYIHVSNIEDLQKIIHFPSINHLSFETSVSNSFHQKNAKMSLKESDNDIATMLHELDNNPYRIYVPKIKVYVSCINKCPIEGKIDSDFILNRLLKINKHNITSICLVDTCGTLTLHDFEYIVGTCHYYGIVPIHKFSLQLHVKNGREEEIEKIIHKALDYKITSFDVSSISDNTNKNSMQHISYELYYKSLCNYISKPLHI